MVGISSIEESIISKMVNKSNYEETIRKLADFLIKKGEKIKYDNIANKYYINSFFPSFPGKAWDRMMEDLYKIANVFISFALIIAGYYVSKKTPNSKGGFRYKWTLASKENWYKTHEFGGKVWIALGLLCLINSFCGAVSIESEIPILGLIPSIFPAIYSYVYYRKYESASKRIN